MTSVHPPPEGESPRLSPAPPTAWPRRQTAVDALRAIACTLVILDHSRTLLGISRETRPAAFAGDVGVILFFVISGYLIGGPFASSLAARKELRPSASYLVRRAARILPGWWVAFLLTVALLPAQGIATPPLGSIFAHLFLVQGYVLQFQQQSALPVGWTLCIEVLFYVTALLAALLVRRYGRRHVSRNGITLYLVGIWCAAAVLGIVQDLTPYSGTSAYVQTARAILSVRHLGLFVPGILLYLHSRTDMHSGGEEWLASLCSHPVRLSACGLVSFGAAIVAKSSNHTGIAGLDLPLLSISMACLLAIVTSGAHLGWLASRPVVSVGTWSYGMYLYHWPAGSLAHRLGLSLYVDGAGVANVLVWIVAAALTFAFTLPLAYLSWRFVEKPLIDWASRRSSRFREFHDGRKRSAAS